MRSQYAQRHERHRSPTTFRRTVHSHRLSHKLKWRSQEGNVKLRALAEQVLADVLTLKHDKGAPLSRATFDELFLTAHQRVAANNT